MQKVKYTKIAGNLKQELAHSLVTIQYLAAHAEHGLNAGGVYRLQEPV